ncbi:MAG: hypothetical protein AAF845_06805 [Bacteroidota bacterium]
MRCRLRLVRLGAGSVLALGLALAGCTRTAPAGLPPGTTVEDLPESESWNAQLRASDDGQPRLEIDAPYLARYDRADTAYVYLGPAPGDSAATVAVRLYEAGQLSASVTAREAWYYEDDGRLVTRGDVRTSVTGEEGALIEAATVEVRGDTVEAVGAVRAETQGAGGARIAAPRLRLVRGGAFEATGGARVEATGGVLVASRVEWDAEAERFRVPGAFSFDGPGERVRGVGLNATSDLARYSFRNATGEIEVRE